MCSPDIPDTSNAQMASIEASKAMADKQFGLQQEALDYFKGRQDKLDATADEVTKRQLALAEETAAQGRDIYKYQTEVFRPVEQSLVSQAMRESTPEYYEKYASEAVARVASANQNAADQMQRNLTGLGVNPNSGMYASAARGLQRDNAAALGAAANEATDRAEALSWARKADVAGIGKGLVGAGNASYGLASGANTGAVGAGATAQNAGAGAIGSPTSYGQLGTTGLNNATSAYNDIYKTQANISGQSSGLIPAAGTALGMWASSGFAT